MNNKGAYKYPAWCQMETALDMYQQDREACLRAESEKLGAEAVNSFDRYNDAAEALIKGVQDLSGPGVLEILAESHAQHNMSAVLGFVDEHVCITLAWEALGMLAVGKERFWDLVALVKDRTPGERAKEFLARVARCYLFGFDCECVIMCRATIDSEFEAEVSGDEVLSWWETTPKGKKGKPAPINLYGRIEASAFAGKMGDAALRASHDIREAGNKAVHKRPLHVDAIEYIRKTVFVLDEIHTSS